MSLPSYVVPLSLAGTVAGSIVLLKYVLSFMCIIFFSVIEFFFNGTKLLLLLTLIVKYQWQLY